MANERQAFGQLNAEGETTQRAGHIPEYGGAAANKLVIQLGVALEENESLAASVAELRADASRMRVYLDAICEHAGGFAVIVDPRGGIVEITASFAELIGPQRLGLIGRNLFALLTDKTDESENGEPVESGRGPLEKALAEEGVSQQEFDMILRTASGRSLAGRAAIRHLYSESSYPEALIVFHPNDGSSEPARNAGWGRDPLTGFETLSVLRTLLDVVILRTDPKKDVLQTFGTLWINVRSAVKVFEAAGQSGGEEMLLHVANCLRDLATPSAQLYRVSLFQFAIVWNKSTEKQCRIAAAQVRDLFSANPFQWKGQRHTIDVSLSFLMLPDADVLTSSIAVDSLEKCALLPTARDTIVVDAAAALRERRESDIGSYRKVMTWLENRLSQNKLQLISQEIALLDPNADAARSLEVFVRVEDEDGAWLEPSHFVPQMRRLGLSFRFDLWMLERLAQHLADERWLLDSYERIWINVTGSSLREPEFVRSMRRTLLGKKLPLEKFGIEVDEVYVGSNTSVVKGFFEALASDGVGVALDRCGAGTNITSLRSLPISVIKIDPGLISRAHEEGLDKAALNWLVESAAVTGATTVACSLETNEMVDVARAAGVRYGQGRMINHLGPLVT